MRVLALARNPERLAQLQAEIPGQVEPVWGDVTQGSLPVEIIQRERPDVLVLNAGASVPIQESRFLTWAAFSTNWEVDVKGTFLWAREALLAPLAPGSAILIVASTAAGSTTPTISGYIAAKTAQVALARCLAVEAEPLGIRVHYLLPTLTPETDLGRRSIQIFARRRGVDEATMTEDLGFLPPLTPAGMGEAAVRILTDPDFHAQQGYRVSGDGLETLGEGVCILDA
jgi:NAD(P)-dependent dehydrogenase (short-subunit alcohol dehydrogenase family)